LAGTVDGQTHHFYTPFRHCTGEAQLDIERVSPDIRKLLVGPQLKIGHHLKFDKHMANREGWVVAAP
jgi:DNA polymerase I-like protein with 3'-5' exonuclease and polymerase domains